MSEPVSSSESGAEPDASAQARPSRLKGLLTQTRDYTAHWPSTLRWIALVLLALAGAALALWLVDQIVFYYVTKSYVDEIADAFDLNRHLANALLIVSFAVAFLFTRLLWSFSKHSRWVGTVGLGSLLVLHSLALWYATRDSFFDVSGKAVKCYVLTRDGRVTYGERAGVDPATGRLCRPMTAEMLERLRQYEKGKRPQLVTAANPTFFDPRTGEPIVWYSRSKDGTIELFDLMGFHPETGEELTPITSSVAEAWKKQYAELKRHVPTLVDPQDFVFFDPRNGAARAWYWKSPEGKYQFYDSAGFEPTSGESLKVVSRDIVELWKKTVLHKTPKQIDPTNYAFFDPVSGAARVWYWKGNGAYAFYDAPGFEPTTGEPLQLISKDAVADWKRVTAKSTQNQAAAANAAPPPPSVAVASQTVSTADLELKARSFLFDYMRMSGESPSDVMGVANTIFADQVDYFGKQTSKDKLLQDKRAYMARWPERSYELKPETVFARCNANSLTCEVGSEFYFRAANGLKTSMGIAANRLIVKFSDSGPLITSENGNVISRAIPPTGPSQQYQYASPADVPPYPAQPQPTNSFQQQNNSIPPEQAIQIFNGVLGGMLRQMPR